MLGVCTPWGICSLRSDVWINVWMDECPMRWKVDGVRPVRERQEELGGRNEGDERGRTKEGKKE